MSDLSSPALASSTPSTSRAYRRYVLVLLTAAYTFNFVDRQIVGILAPAIKHDLSLSDAQLGSLIGFYFAVLYTTLGIPAARLADRVNRVNVVSAALVLWSGFTALSGFAQSFVHLALARVGVGIGEAGGSPPSHSILSDLYPKEERAGALAVYAMGIPIGAALAYLGGGYVLTHFSWRATFIAVGLPGILLAILVKLTVREPPRGIHDQKSAEKDPFASKEGGLGAELKTLWKATKHLLSIPTYRGIVFGLTAGSFASYAIAGWIVAFFRRTHPEMPLPSVLFWLGIITGTAYVLGTFVGGRLVDTLAKRNKAAYGYVPAAALALNVPFFLGAMWVDSPALSLVLWWPAQLLIGFYLGPCFALAQTLAPVSVRALSTAIFFFILNMIALGFGPTFVGFLSDALKADYGEGMGLRIALSTVVVAIFVSIGFFLWVARCVRRDWVEATGDLS
ncbi:MAG: MFS transporter [Myxococcota bacterium]